MERIGPFEVLAELSEGAMATVYVAQRRSGAFRKRVALKVLKPELRRDPVLSELFAEEARILRQTTHAGLCRVFEADTSSSTPYIAMEWVRGPSLADLLSAIAPYGTQDAMFLIAIVQRCAEALAQLHEAKDVEGRPLEIIHRDFGAENIVVGRDGYPRLIDFGVSRHAGRPSLTRTGVLRGRLANCAPETFAGELTQRSDVWALGLLTWRICTQDAPWDESDPAELVYAIQNEPILPPTARGGHGDDMLDAIIGRALERDPTKRTASALAFAAELRMWLDSRGGVPTAEALAHWLASKPHVEESFSLSPSGKRSGGRWLSLYALMAAGVVLAAFGFLWQTRAPDAHEARPSAHTAQTESKQNTEAFAPRRSVVVAEPDSATQPRAGHANAEPSQTAGRTRTRKQLNRASAAQKAEPATGTLNIVTIGSWAEVRVDGEKLGQTPLTAQVPEGRHQISVLPRGAPPGFERTVRIVAGKQERIVIRTDANP